MHHWCKRKEMPFLFLKKCPFSFSTVNFNQIGFSFHTRRWSLFFVIVFIQFFLFLILSVLLLLFLPLLLLLSWQPLSIIVDFLSLTSWNRTCPTLFLHLSIPAPPSEPVVPPWCSTILVILLSVSIFFFFFIFSVVVLTLCIIFLAFNGAVTVGVADE